MNYDVGRVDRGAWLLTDSAQVCTLIKFIDATTSARITVTIRSSGRMATSAIRLRDFHRAASAETVYATCSLDDFYESDDSVINRRSERCKLLGGFSMQKSRDILETLIDSLLKPLDTESYVT